MNFLNGFVYGNLFYKLERVVSERSQEDNVIQLCSKCIKLVYTTNMRITSVHQLCSNKNSLYQNIHFSKRPHINPTPTIPLLCPVPLFSTSSALIYRQLSNSSRTEHWLKTLCNIYQTQEQSLTLRDKVLTNQ